MLAPLDLLVDHLIRQFTMQTLQFGRLFDFLDVFVLQLPLLPLHFILKLIQQPGVRSDSVHSHLLLLTLLHALGELSISQLLLGVVDFSILHLSQDLQHFLAV